MGSDKCIVLFCPPLSRNFIRKYDTNDDSHDEEAQCKN